MKKILSTLLKTGQATAISWLSLSLRKKLFIVILLLILCVGFALVLPGSYLLDIILQIVVAWLFGAWGVISITLMSIVFYVLLIDVRPLELYPWTLYLIFSGFGFLTLFLRTIVIEFTDIAGSVADIERRYQALFERSQDMVFIVDMDQCILAVNQMVLEKLGYLEEELIGEQILKIIDPSELARAEARVVSLIKDAVLPNYERTFIKKDGTQLIGEITPSVVFDAQGEPAYLQSIVRDITRRKTMEDRLRTTESLYKNFMKHSRDSIVLFDLEGKIFQINEYGAKILGTTVDDAIGKTMADFAVPKEQEDSKKALQRVLDGEILATYERTNRTHDGRELTLSINLSLVLDEAGEPLHVQSVARDVSEQKMLNDQLYYLATHDQLTGTLNRRVLVSEIQKMINGMNTHKDKLALFFIDLDKFKPVNDEFGHAMGDHVLVNLADRLRGLQNETDLFARVGGDEFVWIRAGFDTKAELNNLAEDALSLIEIPVAYGGLQASVSASIGIAIYPDDALIVDQLLIHADQAMYVAKEENDIKIVFWDKSINE